MIADDHELELVRTQICELKARRDRRLRQNGRDAFQTHLEVAGIEKMIARLEEEVKTYEQSKLKGAKSATPD